ncbi:hypothetical protein [Allohahella sp. A8]|uniref:hypothetical protein n=1 Tax=Allohahella sp. A8 TaxID=3141461 RepID=UPI003A80FF82
MPFVSEAFKAAFQFLERPIRAVRSVVGPYVSAAIRDGDAFMARPIRYEDYLNDSTPNQFAIQAYFEQPTDTMVEMLYPVVIAGINVTTTIEIDFEQSDPTAFLSVDGKPFAQATQTIQNGGFFRLKVRTSNQLNRQVQVRVVVGGVSAVWLVSTGVEGTSELQTGLSTRLGLYARTQATLTFGFATRSDTQYRVIVVPYASSTPTVAQVLAGQAGNSLAPLYDSGLQNSTGGLQERFTVNVASGSYRAYMVVLDEPAILESASARTASAVTNIIGARILHIRPVRIVRKLLNLHIRNR